MMKHSRRQIVAMLSAFGAWSAVEATAPLRLGLRFRAGAAIGAALATFTLQNAGASPLAAAYISFGQMFKRGASPGASAHLSVIDSGGVAQQVQMDVVSLWPDSTVKFASITMLAPALSVGASASYTLAIQATGDYTPISSATFLAAITSLTTSVSITSPVALSHSYNIKAALTAAFAGTPDVFLQGPLAIQARVDLTDALAGLSYQSFHVVADVTVFKDGTCKASVQYLNDLTTIINTPPGGVLAPLIYTNSVTLNGTTTNYPNGGTISSVKQYQFQKWRVVVTSNGIAPYGFWTSPYNITGINAQLISTGAVLPYDLTPANLPGATLLASYQTLINSTNFGQPFTWNTNTQGGTNDSQNGMYNNPGNGGDASHIGPLTEVNTAWIQTEDYRAAKLALAQGETAGSICVNIGLTGGGRPNVINNPLLWIDPRGGQFGAQAITNILPAAINGTSDLTGWDLRLFSSHSPSLSYVPWLRTADRWYLDNLNSYVSYHLASWSPGGRYFNNDRVYQGTGALPYIVMLTGASTMQLRQSAWIMRDAQHAAFAGKTGAIEQSYANSIVADNWAFAMYQTANWINNQGQATGFWLPYYTVNDAYNACNVTGGCTIGATNCIICTPLWQQDFMSGTALLGALMGYAGAVQFATWQKNWLIGRWANLAHDSIVYELSLFAGPGASPWADICNYVTKPSYAQTWAAIEALQQANFYPGPPYQSITNGSGWGFSQGYYGNTYRHALGAALTLFPGDSGLLAAFNAITASGAPFVDSADWQGASCKWNVVPTAGVVS